MEPWNKHLLDLHLWCHCFTKLCFTNPWVAPNRCKLSRDFQDSGLRLESRPRMVYHIWPKTETSTKLQDLVCRSWPCESCASTEGGFMFVLPYVSGYVATNWSMTSGWCSRHPDSERTEISSSSTRKGVNFPGFGKTCHLFGNGLNSKPTSLWKN